MPSLVFAGDKIIAEMERREKPCLCFSLMTICVVDFASLQVHVCIYKFMFAHTSPYAVEMLLHLSVCMCTFMH